MRRIVHLIAVVALTALRGVDIWCRSVMSRPLCEESVIAFLLKESVVARAAL